MKPIGPYVAARELPGRTGSPVRTLRATDRLTGMPVLLHVLPYPLTLPDLPDHPALLSVVDSGMDGDQAYVVTELPLQARPADDALLTARGALAALSALHERGLTHGGLHAAQLWSVDGRVLLAGAGLPWGGDPLPSDDLYALGVLLAGMGSLPAALRPLTEQPGYLSAAAALARLNSEADHPPTPQAVQEQGPAEQEAGPSQAWPQRPAISTVSPASAATPEPQPPLGDGAGNFRRGQGQDTDADAPLPPAPVSPATPSPAPERPEAGGRGTATADDVPAELAPVTPDEVLPGPVAPDPVTPAPEAAAPAAPDPVTPNPVTPSPVTPSPAGDGAAMTAPGTPETPQERRRRQNEERRAQAILDAQAAAARKAERLRAERAQRLADGGGQDTPIQIGGGPVGAGAAVALGGDDLPAWDGPSVDGEAAPRPTLRMRDVDRLPPGLRREPLPEPDPEPSPRLPARRAPGDPIRIGWDEDESWRVVREAPATPQRTRPRLPRWTLLVMAAALLGGVWWALAALPDRAPAQQGSPQRVTPAVESAAQTASGTDTVAGKAVGKAAGTAARNTSGSADGSGCCRVEFRLRGAQGRTVGLTVEAAPPGANLAPGEVLGRAPGTVQFPLPGTYRLRASVSGYTPATLSVTVPTTKPQIIDLEN
ncbi:hypothetical protein [Deinococcus sp.]|uniref:hypothetical protein n=1 Tax=Deinococcus sp. TaxID=47478 RepID=UPI0025BB2D89|nr:hypothetical protein [Deinococcus sp.]